ncbi:MAG TPA: hypothetical protein VFT57_15740 [Gemmatimonadaceae bacterium]|jgi:hypothetical protein|nr:hypothetical protein [Gemmatimonadaceae bacterium]
MKQSRSRSLTIQRSIVPLSERKKYMTRLRARKAYYQGANCTFCVFEEADLAGAFIEFIEADDPAVLAKALQEAPESLVDASRIYQEVELD